MRCGTTPRWLRCPAGKALSGREKRGGSEEVAGSRAVRELILRDAYLILKPKRGTCCDGDRGRLFEVPDRIAVVSL